MPDLKRHGFPLTFPTPVILSLAVLESGEPSLIADLCHRWRERTNVFRTKWNVNNVPTLARFELVKGKVVEKGRMTEDGIMNAETLKAFMA